MQKLLNRTFGKFALAVFASATLFSGTVDAAGRTGQFVLTVPPDIRFNNPNVPAILNASDDFTGSLNAINAQLSTEMRSAIDDGLDRIHLMLRNWRLNMEKSVTISFRGAPNGILNLAVTLGQIDAKMKIKSDPIHKFNFRVRVPKVVVTAQYNTRNGRISGVAVRPLDIDFDIDSKGLLSPPFLRDLSDKAIGETIEAVVNREVDKMLRKKAAGITATLLGADAMIPNGLVLGPYNLSVAVRGYLRNPPVGKAISITYSGVQNVSWNGNTKTTNGPTIGIRFWDGFDVRAFVHSEQFSCRTRIDPPCCGGNTGFICP